MPALPLPFSNKSAALWITQFQTAQTAEDRLQALQAIRSLCGSTEASACVTQALNDVDATIRALGAKLSGNSGDPASDQTDTRLVSLLNDADPDVRLVQLQPTGRAERTGVPEGNRLAGVVRVVGTRGRAVQQGQTGDEHEDAGGREGERSDPVPDHVGGCHSGTFRHGTVIIARPE